MKARWRRAGRVLAGAQLIFHLGVVAEPPPQTAHARQAELAGQWARQDAATRRARRARAEELRYQLREPLTGEHRRPAEPPQRDRHDIELSRSWKDARVERTHPERGGRER